jgi:hypothetical protein
VVAFLKKMLSLKRPSCRSAVGKLYTLNPALSTFLGTNYFDDDNNNKNYDDNNNKNYDDDNDGLVRKFRAVARWDRGKML